MDYAQRWIGIAVGTTLFCLIAGLAVTAGAQYQDAAASSWPGRDWSPASDTSTVFGSPPLVANAPADSLADVSWLAPPTSPTYNPSASDYPSPAYYPPASYYPPPVPAQSGGWADSPNASSVYPQGVVDLDGNCAECGESCDSCCPCRTVYASFAFVWLQPHFHQGTAIFVDPPPNDNYNLPFSYDYELSPRVTVGCCSPGGLGIQARYWQLDYSAAPVSFSVPAGLGPAIAQVNWGGTSLFRTANANAGETLTASHGLQLDVVDVEVTRSLSWGNSAVLVGFGLQYVDMEQRYSAVARTAAGALSESVIHTHDFSGYGPTMLLSVNHAFGFGGLAAYGGLRGSVLFGDARQEILESRFGGAQVARDYAETSQTRAIGEIELGLEYSRRLNRGLLVFVRGGYEGQIWFDAGGPLSNTGDMGLEGLVLSIGLVR